MLADGGATGQGGVESTPPDGRVAEQRQRNRFMDTLALLASGEVGASRDGGAWRAAVLGWGDDGEPWAWLPWSVFVPAEVGLLSEVQTEVMISQGEVAGLKDDALVASGWPSRIGELAAPTLHVMNARGRFSEQPSELEPSGPCVDLHDQEHLLPPKAEIPAGEVVDVTVVCHHSFGLGVWVANYGQFGHVNLPAISDGRIDGREDYPQVGARMRARTLGYSGHQLRLTTRRSDLPGLTERGATLVRQLAQAVGAEVDPESEHSRWHVYWEALPREELRALLKDVTTEGEGLSPYVVIEVLKYVDTTEGRTWVDLLKPSDGRDYAERRLREWSLIREVLENPRRIVEDLPDLTLWCQRRLVERASSELVLNDLAEHGTARKVRNAAREKLRRR